MKIAFFSIREDDYDFVIDYSKKYNIEATICADALTMDTIHLCKNQDGISILTTKLDYEMITTLHHYHVDYISTRTIGYDHIDMDACKKYNMHVSNVSYTIDSVAQYTIMMILMSLRNIPLILKRFDGQDFGLYKIRGKELKGLTVGVIGCGKIGQAVIAMLEVFECNVIVYDAYPDLNNSTINYVSLETLYTNSDIITLHAPGNKDTYHMINKASIALMKDDVILVNTARGSLIDSDDLIDAIEQHHIGYASLDVVEYESLLYYKDLKHEVLSHRQLAILRSFPNVLLTPHTAFFTDEAVSDMVENSIISLQSMYTFKPNPWKIL